MDSSREDLREALKRVAVALKHAEIPFALTGGYAVWARGGPEPDHDVDFLIAREDVERAVQSLTEQGLDVVRPPEDWLVKVFTDNAMVDLIHRHSDAPAERATVQDADVLEVLSVQMPVLSATEVVVQKMLALHEHECDFAAMIPVMRALREQLDLPRVRRETAQSPFAAALLLLLERLDVIEPECDGPGGRSPDAHQSSGFEAMHALLESLTDAQNAHDVDLFASHFTHDYQSDQPAHPGRQFTGREQVHENWSAVFAGVSDFRAELLASCRDRDVEWGEVHWHGHYGDGSPFAMRGVIIATIRDEQIAAARLYVEPVAGREEDIEEAVEHLYRPPRDDT